MHWLSNQEATRKIMSDKLNRNLWGGRFKGEADPGFAEFNRSFGFDRRLFEVDVRASIAHCDGLTGASVLTTDEAEKIKSALATILEHGRVNAATSTIYPLKMCIHLSKRVWLK